MDYKSNCRPHTHLEKEDADKMTEELISIFDYFGEDQCVAEMFQRFPALTPNCMKGVTPGLSDCYIGPTNACSLKDRGYTTTHWMLKMVGISDGQSYGADIYHGFLVCEISGMQHWKNRCTRKL